MTGIQAYFDPDDESGHTLCIGGFATELRSPEQASHALARIHGRDPDTPEGAIWAAERLRKFLTPPTGLSVTIEGEAAVRGLSKMLYPGFEVKCGCPRCDTNATWDGHDNYISYPTPGELCTVGMYCDACGHKWRVGVRLNLTLTHAPEGDTLSYGDAS